MAPEPAVMPPVPGLALAAPEPAVAPLDDTLTWPGLGLPSEGGEAMFIGVRGLLSQCRRLTIAGAPNTEAKGAGTGA
ncbi:hypothetical protein [Streptomyces sp. YGL11-2]|uniref:hypothetical protein n=1 Tax=Streptomyces sp. YGL11-2 TaxID=3414028 RepID=UPI003CF153C2